MKSLWKIYRLAHRFCFFVTSTSVLPASEKATKPGRCGPVPCVDGTVVEEVDAGRDELDAEEAVPRVPGLHVDTHLCAAWHILQHQETAFLEPNLLWIRVPEVNRLRKNGKHF